MCKHGIKHNQGGKGLGVRLFHTAEALSDHVAGRIGKLARPKQIVFADDLPKTRSGKIMRRLLRDIAAGNELGDVTTLRDPSVVETLQEKVETQG